MMNVPAATQILIAPQSFKGSLTAEAVGAAIASGVNAGWPWAHAPNMRIVPLADGGEGTVAALVAANPQASSISLTIRGPLPGQQVEAPLGWIPGPIPTAVIEMASAAGLPLIPPDARDPARATTLGVGDLIRAALDRGARRILLGLGGSATNDGGAGMAVALGVCFRDAAGDDLPPGGLALAGLDHIDLGGLDPRLDEVAIIGLCDVTNPLYGAEGATVIYGPQKGATPELVTKLDAALAHYAGILARDTGRDVAAIPGSGAAGGLGAGLLAFGGPQTRLERGAEAILDAIAIDTHLAWADLVMTGEGRLDDQIRYGKVTGVLATRAAARQIPVIAVVGGLGNGYEVAYDLGITAVVIASDGPRSLTDAMTHAHDLIATASERALRLWRALPAMPQQFG